MGGGGRWPGRLLRGALRHAVALLSVLVAVGGLLLGMAWLKLAGAPPEAAPEERQSAAIEVLRSRRPPRQRPQPSPHHPTQEPAPPDLPALELSSSVALPLWTAPPPAAPGVLHACVDDMLTLPDSVRVFDEHAVDEPPRAVFRQAPRYPPGAEAEGTEGEVRARILVGVDGRVQQVSVVEGRPPGVFDASAAAALRSYIFRPARFHGEAVPVWVRQRLVFRLE